MEWCAFKGKWVILEAKAVSEAIKVHTKVLCFRYWRDNDNECVWNADFIIYICVWFFEFNITYMVGVKRFFVITFYVIAFFGTYNWH